MTNNYNRFKEWLGLASNNIDKVIKFYKINEYSACVFRIQLSTEQLQKGLIFLLGLQFRKTHEPSKILEAIENNSSIQIEKKNLSLSYKNVKNTIIIFNINPKNILDKSIV